MISWKALGKKRWVQLLKNGYVFHKTKADMIMTPLSFSRCSTHLDLPDGHFAASGTGDGLLGIDARDRVKAPFLCAPVSRCFRSLARGPLCVQIKV